MSEEDKQKLREYKKAIVKQRKYHYKFFLQIVYKMSKTNFNFGVVEFTKKTFHKFQRLIDMDKVNIGKAVI